LYLYFSSLSLDATPTSLLEINHPIGLSLLTPTLPLNVNKRASLEPLKTNLLTHVWTYTTAIGMPNRDSTGSTHTHTTTLHTSSTVNWNKNAVEL
jgi:hypothetical protein